MQGQQDDRGARHLLVVGMARSPHYREAVLRELAGRYPLWLLCQTPPAWALPYLAGWTTADMSDRADPAGVLRAVERLADDVVIGGVVTAEEDCVELAAHLTEALGLPGISPQAAGRCRDKAATRRALEHAGIPGARAFQVHSQAEAEEAVLSLGLPVVVKPRAMAGSRGVRRVDDLGELAHAYTYAVSTTPWYDGPTVHDGVLIEEFLDGPNISLSSVVVDTVVHPLAAARVTTIQPPYFLETDHIVDGQDPLLTDPEFLRMVQDVHTALGITAGTTLSQWCLTSRGPRLIEVNARLGGDLVQVIGGPANGLNVIHAWADTAMGHHPHTHRTPSGAAAITFLFPDHDLTVDTLTHTGTAPAGTDIVLLAHPGTTLHLPPRGAKPRYAYVTARGADLATCVRNLNLARAAVELTATADLELPENGPTVTVAAR
ncbi:ATP-grasp domain-containing protein [Kitasatospora sp. MAP5-34]|uniref:ATP-grasp domain-containing protein n=1 Tax=Kitasatospora sp. MAP5-34 TaxID=3035102 RepID=UPI00247684A0|nr:ATP-grasp domain-containing protein [Kitasatospora sp. MAP5-34]MDH6578555.1 biotin carboxylase [Kitasatospora sp. MAP5-34]